MEKLSQYNSVMNTPFNIGSVQIKNRFVMCAMGGLYLYRLDGAPAEDAYQYYIDRAKGGVGLIITRAIIVRPIGLKYNLYEKPEIFAPLKQLTTEVHKYGAKIFMQLSGGAGRTLHSTVEKMEKRGIKKEDAFFAPSDDLPNFWYPEIKHRALTHCEIKEYVTAFAEMAKIAKDCGFDGVEIHALHEGYLLDQFATACTNNRTDEYGGSLEARFRFPCEIIESIKEICGNDFPVTMRYSVASKMTDFKKGTLPNVPYKEFGRTIEESIVGAGLLEKAGCDAFDADNGAYDAWFWAHPPVYMPDACNIQESAILKKHTNVPVICAGKLDIDNCEKYINDDSCDAIGIARALLADPEYVNKYLNNQKDEIKPCIGCHIGCLGNMQKGGGIGCALNPTAFPRNIAVTNVCDTKKIAIIGAGVSGMEAAIRLKEAGYDVTIYEKSEKSGGVFVAAASFTFKDRDKTLLKWYESQLNRLNISVIYNTEIDIKSIDELEEDVIICATGAEKNRISSLEKHAEYAIDFLNDQDENKYVDDTVIIGGGLTGCEIAYEFAKMGKKVSIIEIQSEILSKHMCEANKQYLLNSLEEYEVSVYTNSNVIDITNKNVSFISNENEFEIPCNKLILANGYHSNPLFDDYCDTFKEKKIFYIGDSKEVGNLMTAIHSAYSVSKNFIK